MILKQIKEDFQGRRFLIVGFSKRTGLSCAKLLDQLYLDYAVFDEKPLEATRLLLGKAKSIYTKTDDVPFDDFDLLLLSPGFPRRHELIQKAKFLDKKIFGDIDFIFPYLNGKVSVGVTGTDGKTTTTALIEAVLSRSYAAISCGNNEKPIFDQIEAIEKAQMLVIELSSYMLEENHRIKPSFSIITNIAQDHLSRYESFEEYRNTKSLIFKHQDGGDVFLHNIDDENIENFFKQNKRPPHLKTLSMKNPDADYYFDGEYFRFAGNQFSSRSFQLLGLHNRMNALFAIAVGHELGVGIDEIEAALNEFNPLEHRMERVLTKRKVLVVNDAKSTTVQATQRAIESFEGSSIVLILGGSGKELSYVSLNQYGEIVKKVFTYGEEGEKIKADLRGLRNVAYIKDFDACVKEAWGALVEGDVFLLSPAAASFDQFSSYKERGEAFKKRITALDEDFKGDLP